MKKMPVCSLVLLSFFVSHIVSAQNTPTIKGTVQDAQTHKPIGNIVLQCQLKDAGNVSTPKWRVLADSLGHFEIKPGTHTLLTFTIEAAGYQPLQSDVHTDTLQIANDTLQLPVFYLQVQEKHLQTVTVTSQKRILELQADRMVYNVKADPMAAGNNMFSLLGRQPFFMIDAYGKLQYMNGRYKVYINGRPSGIARYDPESFLKMTQGLNVDHVDIITAPSAKYDMEGASIIIDIITIRIQNGYNVSIDGSATTFGGYTAGASGMLQSGKWGLSTSVNLAGGTIMPAAPTSSTMYNHTDNTTTLMNDPGMKLNQERIRTTLAISYEKDKQNLFNASASYRNDRTPIPEVASTYSTYDDNDNLIRNYANSFTSLITSKDYTLDVDYLHTFRPDTSRRVTQNLSAAYRYTGSTSGRQNNSYSIGDNALPGSRNMSDGNGYEHTLQADYTYDSRGAKKYKLDVGAKVIFRHNVEETGVYMQLADKAQFDSIAWQTGGSRYNQAVYSSYVNVTLPLKKWALSLGSRAEYSHNTGYFPADTTSINNHFFYLMPVCNISYMLSPASRFMLRFSSTVQKPNISSLNPAIQYTNATSASFGNPNLLPERTNNIDLRYSYMSKKQLMLSTSLNFGMKNNGFEYFSWIGADSIIYRSTFNSATSRTLRLMVMASQSFFNRSLNISISGTPTLYWLNNTLAQQKATNLSAYFNSNVGYTFKNGLSLNASCNYNTSMLNLQTKTNALFSNQVYISKGWFNYSLITSISITSPFQKEIKRNLVINSLNADIYRWSVAPQRMATVNVIYSFSKNIKSRRKNYNTISNDDTRNL